MIHVIEEACLPKAPSTEIMTKGYLLDTLKGVTGLQGQSFPPTHSLLVHHKLLLCILDPLGEWLVGNLWWISTFLMQLPFDGQACDPVFSSGAF